ncbi:MAG: glycosyltransferase family 61 protein [Oscillatoriales cyanobacterium]|jgi:capsular polysaccharide biosynthesis protein|nr:MAG: glycosyltransferase family 61 protein [Oscillatoriales cyanobacterium]
MIDTNLKDLAEKNEWLFEVIETPIVQIRKPSNTLEEDIFYVIKNGETLINNSPSSQLAGTKIAREKDFYDLYCITAYEIAETFRCTIPCATVLNAKGLVVTSNLEILSQSVYGQNMDVSLNLEQIKQNLDSSQVLPGTYVSLLSNHTLNYAHWLMDSLPKLALLESLSSDLNFIIPDGSPRYIIDALNLLGIQEDQIVKIKEESIVVENLILCHAAQNPGRPSKTHLLTTRNRLLASVADRKSNRSSHRRIYISRSNSSRKIVNEAEILPILKDYNFEIIHCEELSLVEQIEIFSEAQVVLGSHGAGIYNQIFCKPGAIIIEIYNKHYWYHSSWIVANLMEHIHWHIFGENVDEDWQTWVDPLKLQKILSLALTH